MTTITVLGIGLSTLALIGLVGTLVDCLRRRPLRVLGSPLEDWRARVARALGSVALLAGFLVGLAGLPLISSSREIGDAGIVRGVAGLDAGGAADAGGSATVTAAAQISTSWRLPFYVERTTRVVSTDGATLGGSIRRTLQLPWVFLCSVAAYWITFVRTPRRTPAATGSGRTGR